MANKTMRRPQRKTARKRRPVRLWNRVARDIGLLALAIHRRNAKIWDHLVRVQINRKFKNEPPPVAHHRGVGMQVRGWDAKLDGVGFHLPALLDFESDL